MKNVVKCDWDEVCFFFCCRNKKASAGVNLQKTTFKMIQVESNWYRSRHITLGYIIHDKTLGMVAIVIALFAQKLGGCHPRRGRSTDLMHAQPGI